MSTLPTPLPRVAAFERLGFGMFLHWGLYSQLGRGEWIEHEGRIPRTKYGKLLDSFTAEDFDARSLARTAREAGMKYITLTSRHHEGFSLYDTCGLNDFDAPHSAARRDLIREFVEGCRAEGIAPFLYHATFDWSWHGKTTRQLSRREFDDYLDYLLHSIELLCRNYGELGGLWLDGNWSRKDVDWKEERLYKMVRAHQPDIILINNSGLGALGAIGNAELDAVTYENNAAKPLDRRKMRKYVACEVCKTMNHHWGHAENDFHFLSPKELIEMLCHSRGCGANFLLNIGLTAQGGLPAYEKAALEVVGKWCQIHGEALYGAKPVPNAKCQGRDFLLENGETFYYFAFDLGVAGSDNVVGGLGGEGLRTIEGSPRTFSTAVWLDNGEAAPMLQDAGRRFLAIHCSAFSYGRDMVVRVLKLK